MFDQISYVCGASMSDCQSYPCLNRMVCHCGCLCVTVCRILFVRCHFGEIRDGSCSIAVIAVIQKHSVMARMILTCIAESAHSCFFRFILVYYCQGRLSSYADMMCPAILIPKL